MALALLHAVLALLLAPLLGSLTNRTKATFAGRKGAPWLQPYHDLARLLRKGAVYSPTTTWIFKASPLLGLACGATLLLIIPFAGRRALVSFAGDPLLLCAMFGLWRFGAILAALDTGSSFEGMGASREAAFSALAEPALILALVAIGRLTDQLSLSSMLAALSVDTWSLEFPALLLIVGALGLVYLAESGRMPFDDPTTHLELTMIHEVMVLDHSGPDLAFIHYGAALKLWILGALIVDLIVPAAGIGEVAALALSLAGMTALAIATGVLESIMARAPLARVPKLLGSASLLSVLALLLIGR